MFTEPVLEPMLVRYCTGVKGFKSHGTWLSRVFNGIGCIAVSPYPNAWDKACPKMSRLKYWDAGKRPVSTHGMVSHPGVLWDVPLGLESLLIHNTVRYASFELVCQFSFLDFFNCFGFSRSLINFSFCFLKRKLMLVDVIWCFYHSGTPLIMVFDIFE